ncbi:DNA-binding response regulator [Streptomyces sp. NPDC050504]|uniref:DNA-binding response regulator n=1 Tax=Streptomyces sp. NPDC050504 TaxID=3365618 RepID=UPI0037BD49F1
MVTNDHSSLVEQALLEASALIESTVSLHRRSLDGPSPIARADKARIRDAVVELMGRARHSVGIALTGPGELADTVAEILVAREPELSSAQPGPTGGVVVRVLCTPDALDTPIADADLARDMRLEVRVVEGELREAVVVDGMVALVRSVREKSDGHAAVVNDPAVVRALELLFAGAWSTSRTLTDHLGLSPRLHTELTRSILEKLRVGHTDDVAARELQVSLRTYRRHVAEIMRELGANSRFQAGVRAVELGLLPEQG